MTSQKSQRIKGILTRTVREEGRVCVARSQYLRVEESLRANDYSTMVGPGDDDWQTMIVYFGIAEPWERAA